MCRGAGCVQHWGMVGGALHPHVVAKGVEAAKMLHMRLWATSVQWDGEHLLRVTRSPS